MGFLATGEHRLKIRFGQDAGHLRAFVPLNLDLAILHRATGATGALQQLGQLLFFWQTDARDIFSPASAAA